MGQKFADVQRSLWRLERNQKILRNQREVLQTLSLAMGVAYGKVPWYDDADSLLVKVATEVLETCEQIALDSSLVGREGAGE